MKRKEMPISAGHENRVLKRRSIHHESEEN
jgi:hypothetical protein